MKPGYTGHVPRAFNTQEQVAGFSEATKSKFSRAAVTMISSNSYGGTTKVAASGDLRKKDYVIPSRKGIYATKRGVSKPKRFVAKTSNSSEFVNHMSELLKLENLSDGAITAAFRKVDIDRSGFIDKTEIYNLLGTVFGDVPDQRMVTALIAHFDTNKDGKISLFELTDGLRAVARHKRGQMGRGVRNCQPKWMEPPNRAKANAVSNAVSLSMQATDVGGTGEELRDLEHGTQKGTSHLPGYSGYIPTTTGNAAAVQARADAERADKSRLILCETYAPKIRVDLEMRYGSMQTTNSKRTAAVDRSWKEYKSR